LAVVLNNLGNVPERDSVLRILRGYENSLSAYEAAELGSYRAIYSGDIEGRVAHLRRAVELAPRSPSVYNLSNDLGGSLNRPREGLELLRTVDPEHGWARELVWYGFVNLSEIPAKTHDLENRKAQYTVVSCLSETSIQARISSS
jgi:hypothetical protein